MCTTNPLVSLTTVFFVFACRVPLYAIPVVCMYHQRFPQSDQETAEHRTHIHKHL